MRCFLAALLGACILGCGVKGKPLPPTTAPVLGRGEPNFSKVTEKVKLKKKPKTSDWEDSFDFPEEREK